MRFASRKGSRVTDLGGESGWEEDIDDILREAAVAAGWSDFEA